MHSDLAYTLVETPIGTMLLVVSSTGLRALQFGAATALEADVRSRSPHAVPEQAAALAAYVHPLLAYFAGRRATIDVPLDVHPTAFQQRVWAALREIPYGCTRTYKEVAAAIGAPTATRAVAGACAANPVAVVVPCHRVVRTDGGQGGYRWGMERKAALLQLEQARRRTLSA